MSSSIDVFLLGFCHLDGTFLFADQFLARIFTRRYGAQMCQTECGDAPKKSTIVRCASGLEPCKTKPAYWDSEGEAMSILSPPELQFADASSRLVSTDAHWYAVSTRSRHERSVRDRLAAIGVEPFLPLTKTLRQWSDRKVWTEMPLFSGYCFARFSLRDSLSILQTPGVVRIVGSIGPESVPDEELMALKALSTSERTMEPHEYYIEGA